MNIFVTLFICIGSRLLISHLQLHYDTILFVSSEKKPGGTVTTHSTNNKMTPSQNSADRARKDNSKYKKNLTGSQAAASPAISPSLELVHIKTEKGMITQTLAY